MKIFHFYFFFHPQLASFLYGKKCRLATEILGFGQATKWRSEVLGDFI